MDTLSRAVEIPVVAASSSINDLSGEVYFDVPADKAYTFKGFNFYTIDINNTSSPRLDAIIEQWIHFGSNQSSLSSFIFEPSRSSS